MNDDLTHYRAGEPVAVLVNPALRVWRPGFIKDDAPYRHRSCVMAGAYVLWANLSADDYRNGESSGGWHHEAVIYRLDS